MDTREALLDSDAVVVGNAAKSELIQLATGDGSG